MFVLCLSVALVVLDQAAKDLVLHGLLYGADIPVWPGFFNLSHIHNTGAAWGMMQGANLLLTSLSVVMLILLVCFRRALIGETPLARITLALMIGGICGNLLDRLRLGYVVDYLHFYWRDHHFPSFNIADSCICVGVGLYIIAHLIWGKEVPPEATPSSPSPGESGS